ncbi:MAG: hypothetical protein ACRDF4_00425 [Rhabdochlamydiaceae bacterium]
MTTSISNKPFVVDLKWEWNPETNYVRVYVPKIPIKDKVTAVVEQIVGELEKEIHPIIEATNKLRITGGKYFEDLVICGAYAGLVGTSLNGKAFEFFWDPKKVRDITKKYLKKDVDQQLNSLDPNKKSDQQKLALFEVCVSEMFKSFANHETMAEAVVNSQGVKKRKLEVENPIEYDRVFCNLPLIKSLAFECYSRILKQIQKK